MRKLFQLIRLEKSTGNENKPATFFECGFVKCYRCLKTCIYLNNVTARGHDRDKNEQRLKARNGSNPKEHMAFCSKGSNVPEDFSPRENYFFPACACFHKHTLVLSTSSREDTERTPLCSFLSWFPLNPESFPLCTHPFLAHSQRLISMKQTQITQRTAPAGISEWSPPLLLYPLFHLFLL